MSTKSRLGNANRGNALRGNARRSNAGNARRSEPPPSGEHLAATSSAPSVPPEVQEPAPQAVAETSLPKSTPALIDVPAVFTEGERTTSPEVPAVKDPAPVDDVAAAAPAPKARSRGGRRNKGDRASSTPRAAKVSDKVSGASTGASVGSAVSEPVVQAKAANEQLLAPVVKVTATLPDSPKAKVEEKPAARGEKASAAANDPTLDEISIPPVGDIDERFFAEGRRSEQELLTGRTAAAAQAEAEMDLSPDSKIVHKMRPEVRARRQKFARYVEIAIGISAILCVAAAVQVSRARANTQEARPAAAAMVVPAAASAPQGVAAPDLPAVPPEAVHAQPGDKPQAVFPEQAAAPAVDPAAAPNAAPVAAKDGAVANPALLDIPTKTALEEKKDSRVALERGQFKKAVDAGERSVALDPTDGEAWLMLGAAYQSQGNNADAHRCFAACLKEGKKGPLSECRAMLR